MSTPCEIVVQKVLPVIRANLAKELVNKHRMRQSDVAKHLGLTQPAVSHYLKDFRGKSESKIKDAEFHRRISDFAARLSKGTASGSAKQDFVCELCRHCRSTALICKFHPPEHGSKCSICLRPLQCD